MATSSFTDLVSSSTIFHLPSLFSPCSAFFTFLLLNLFSTISWHFPPFLYSTLLIPLSFFFLVHQFYISFTLSLPCLLLFYRLPLTFFPSLFYYLSSSPPILFFLCHISPLSRLRHCSVPDVSRGRPVSTPGQSVMIFGEYDADTDLCPSTSLFPSHYNSINSPQLYFNHLPPNRYAVVQLVEALRFKREGRGLDSRWSHWNFSFT